MEKSFWSEAARCGVYVGLLLAVSSVVETKLALSGNLSLYVVVLFELVAAVVLHFYLLYRFTRQRSALYSADEGFSFGQGYGYVLAMSLLAGVIAGVVDYIFVHVVIGYSSYVERFTGILAGLADRGGRNPLVDMLIEQLRTTPEPSLFATLWGGVGRSLLFGALSGLVIAGVTMREPKLFSDNDSEHE